MGRKESDEQRENRAVTQDIETIGDGKDEALLLSEAQVLLSEKRTSLSAIRTGIAVVALPLSIVSVLIATSDLYAEADVRHLLVPVLAACALLFLLGFYLILHALVHMRRYDQKLAELKAQNSALAQIVD